MQYSRQTCLEVMYCANARQAHIVYIAEHAAVTGGEIVCVWEFHGSWKQTWIACADRVAECQLQLVNEAAFSQADEQAAGFALQQIRQSQQGHKSLQSMAELLCNQTGLQQAHKDGSLWDAAVKPFVPLPLAVLQPNIRVSSYNIQ